jgi:hypothetical protein
MTKPVIVIEQFISDFLNDVYPSLDNEYSYLYGLENTQAYLSGAGYPLDKAKDVYTLINKDSTKAYSAMYDTLAFFTFGWAAPYQPDDEIPASQHSDRIRILLALFSDMDGNVVAAMKHCDDPSEPLAFQHGEQQGELYNAIQSMYNYL